MFSHIHEFRQSVADISSTSSMLIPARTISCVDLNKLMLSAAFAVDSAKCRSLNAPLREMQHYSGHIPHLF